MYSRDHAIVSLVVGLAGVWALSLPAWLPWWGALAWAVALGVGVDFDHFLIARLRTGEWTALDRVLRNPQWVLTAPGRIFDEDDIWAIQRLLSHVLIGGALVGVLWFWNEPLAALSAVVLYAHVLADLAWDNYRIDEYLRQHAEYVRREGLEADGEG